MNKILITGASGYLGRALCKNLSPNHHITTLGRGELSGDHVSMDLKNPFELSTKFELVIHAAGLAHGMDHDQRDYFGVNVTGTKHLLKALEEAPPKALVFISSVAVYGRVEGLDLDEETSLEAKDAYGLSKIKAEELVTSWCNRHKIPATILRIPLVLAGKNPPGNLGMMKKALQKGRYFNIGAGEALRSMILAEDIAIFMEAVYSRGGIFNLTDGRGASFSEISELTSRQLKIKNAISVPKWVAYPVAICGDLFTWMSIKFPFTTAVYRKMTKSLTFASKRMDHITWNPKRVIEHFEI